jgi:hypothetical protein
MSDRHAATAQLADFLFVSCQAEGDDYPSTEIKSDQITAKLYLPDAEKGYYRGTRFDWSGVIHSLTYQGHEYFGEWQESNDPYLHDHITGPVNEFRTNDKGLGYDEAGVGGHFIRIGVGVCEKPEEADYQWRNSYKVVDPGKWTTRSDANWIEFPHELVEPVSGYSYRYSKRLTLSPDKPELVVSHELANTGSKAIETNVYNHNFFVIDNQATGPDFTVWFPFDLIADRDLKGYAEVRGKELAYLKEVPQGESILTLLTGYGATEDDHRFAISNRKAKAGVRMQTDKPLSRLQFWSPHTTLCPEPYIDFNIAPGESDRWTIRYEFYTLE